MIEQEIASGLCLLRLDRPPLNTIDDALLASLREAIGRAENDPAVTAILLTGGCDHFSAGADIHLFERITSAEEARELSKRFQEAFQSIEDCSKPIACGLAGHVMGGALELAMACHRRIATPGARFSLPEIRLALLPGAGGTQRLPRLVGPRKALELMLTGKSVSAAEALELGLVDAVCEAGELADCARCLSGSRQPPPRTGESTDKIDGGAILEAVAEAEKLIRKHPAEVVAPRRIVDCVVAGQRGFAAGILAEREAFAECMQSRAAKNRVYAFFATRQTTKLPELRDVETRPIERVAVIGMGSMGTGIAQTLATAGVEVSVFDQSAETVQKAIERIRRSLERRVERGRLTPEEAEAILSRIVGGKDDATLAEADLILESVFELLDVKQAVLRRIEAACGRDAIVATNTSTLSLDALAEAMNGPERLIGMHFFNPAHSMPLVEVVRRGDTPDEIVASVIQFAKRLRKTPVLVNNREGFLVNRIFVPYLVEAFALLEEGAPPREIDAAMVEFGFPMGPLTLSDMTGIDIVAHAHRELHSAFLHHGPAPGVLQQLVAQGRLGQKSGAGIYRYEQGDRAALDDPALDGILDEVRTAAATVDRRSFSREQITNRLVGRMLAEAFRVLEENVARSEADLDAALVLGTGFPDHRGGIVRYARDRGLDTVLEELENLSSICSERYAPSAYLRGLVSR